MYRCQTVPWPILQHPKYAKFQKNNIQALYVLLFLSLSLHVHFISHSIVYSYRFLLMCCSYTRQRPLMHIIDAMTTLLIVWRPLHLSGSIRIDMSSITRLIPLFYNNIEWMHVRQEIHF